MCRHVAIVSSLIAVAICASSARAQEGTITFYEASVAGQPNTVYQAGETLKAEAVARVRVPGGGTETDFRIRFQFFDEVENLTNEGVAYIYNVQPGAGYAQFGGELTQPTPMEGCSSEYSCEIWLFFQDTTTGVWVPLSERTLYYILD